MKEWNHLTSYFFFDKSLLAFGMAENRGLIGMKDHVGVNHWSLAAYERALMQHRLQLMCMASLNLSSSNAG